MFCTHVQLSLKNIQKDTDNILNSYSEIFNVIIFKYFGSKFGDNKIFRRLSLTYLIIMRELVYLYLTI